MVTRKTSSVVAARYLSAFRGLSLTHLAAPATSLDVSRDYYHGTPSDKAGKNILREGIHPPDLTTRSEPFRPVSGRVYITTKLRYAIIYALGANVLGHDLPKGYLRGSEWGYLFVIPGSELREVHPDEDSVGEMVWDGNPAWLRALAKDVLDPDLFDLVMDGLAAEQSEAGKILLDQLSTSQELELISLGAHIAHEGKLRPKSCWKIHKGRSSELKEDGSNFFDIAEKCR